MAAPPKPWEKGFNRQGLFGANPVLSNRLWSEHGVVNAALNSLEGHISNLPQNADALGARVNRSHSRSNKGPPPVPARPSQQLNSYGHHSRYGHGYAAAPYSSFSHYSPFLTNYNYGSRYGYSGVDDYGFSDNQFVRMAEESSRQAFGSIESIVQAFASVSMMLESTYHAVYSSFRAVLGVADHFSRLRVQLTQIISTLALIRTLQWLFRKALYMLGLSKENPSTQAAWSQAVNSTSNTKVLDESDLKRSRSSWPIIMYFGVVFGAPWLIWKLLSRVTQSENTETWMTREGDHYIGVALYDFHAEGDKELSLTAGQEVTLAPRGFQPRVRGWLRASVDGKTVGLVPANYLRIHGFRKGTKKVPQDVNRDQLGETAVENEDVQDVVDLPPEENESLA